MSMAFGALYRLLQDRLDDDSSASLVIIKRQINLVYRGLCQQYPWTFLRRSTSLAFTANQTTGTLLPGDMCGIYYICDADDNEWNFRDQVSRRNDVGNQKWYYDNIDTTALSTGTDLTVTASGTTCGSVLGAFPNDLSAVGHYIRIGSNEGIYKIATNADHHTLTLSTPYKGDSETGALFEIRPVGTLRMLIDPADAETLTCYYWVKPMPLYLDGDQLLFRGPDTALVDHLESILLRWQKSSSEGFNLAQQVAPMFEELQASDPAPRIRVPRTATHSRLFFGREK